jgi:hypothetical protein
MAKAFKQASSKAGFVEFMGFGAGMGKDAGAHVRE